MVKHYRCQRRRIYRYGLLLSVFLLGLSVLIVPITLISIQTNDEYFEKFMVQYQSIKHRLTELKSDYKYADFIQWNRTLCSKTSDYRGAHQKIISISVYEKESKSTDNQMFSWEKTIMEFIKPLANEINLLLPQWILRIYIDFTGSTKSQRDYLNKFPNIDLCDINNLPLFDSSLHSFLPGKMWRFLPVFDPYVDFFLSHDFDSPITQREIETINVWLSNNEKQNFFYIVRDNIQHGMPILSGLWGAAMKRARYQLFRIFQPMLIQSIVKNYTENGDQLFLNDYVWDFIKDNATIFDSYSCKEFKGRPFLSQRSSGTCYLGCIRPCCTNVRKQDVDVTIKPCPIECRPKQHLDWIYC